VQLLLTGAGDIATTPHGLTAAASPGGDALQRDRRLRRLPLPGGCRPAGPPVARGMDATGGRQPLRTSVPAGRPSAAQSSAAVADALDAANNHQNWL
jgi:hypothetical protein